MHILSVKDPAFRKYGRVITNVDFTQLVEEMKKTPVPDGGKINGVEKKKTKIGGLQNE